MLYNLDILRFFDIWMYKLSSLIVLEERKYIVEVDLAGEGSIVWAQMVFLYVTSMGIIILLYLLIFIHSFPIIRQGVDQLSWRWEPFWVNSPKYRWWYVDWKQLLSWTMKVRGSADSHSSSHFRRSSYLEFSVPNSIPHYLPLK